LEVVFMIAFFRRALSSWLVLGLLGLIMVAFIITGVGSPGAGGGVALFNDWAAKAGSVKITPEEVEARVKSQLQAARQQNQGLEMPAFVAQGGLDNTLDQMLNSRALELFALRHDMAASRRLVDSEIATIQAFRGPTGSFDRATFLNAIGQAGLTEQQVREDIARDKLVSALIIPAQGGARASMKMSTLYASLLLESRAGEIAAIPGAAIAKPAPPSEAELNQFYTRNAIRYTVPETRTVKYALFDRSRFAQTVQVSDADVAAAYKADAGKYVGKETRVFTQAVFADQQAAQAVVAKTRSGTPIAVAAKASGVDAVTLAPQDEGAFAGLTSSAAAKAAFAAAIGAVLDPQKTPFGWNVIRLDSINASNTQALASVRPQLVEQIKARKMDGALADLVTKLEDAVADGGTFDDVAKANGLTVVSTPAITASGVAPDNPGFQRDSAILPILKDAFQAAPDDEASVVTLVPGTAYAFYDLISLNNAAPRPLAAIRTQVVADFQADRASKVARQIADAIAGKVNSGTSLADAVASAGVTLPPARPISARRIDLAQGGAQVPPPVALMFSMAKGKAKVLAMENNQGWFVVNLKSTTPGDAKTLPGLTERTQQEMSATLGDEYVAQMANAVRKDVGVERNANVIGALKRRLTGAPAAR
jgi:peptidyl-prolyl cis-trans isomerase D